MIPFICLNVLGLPRTAANQNITRQKVKRFFQFCAILAGILILAAEVLAIIQLAFTL